LRLAGWQLRAQRRGCGTPVRYALDARADGDPTKLLDPIVDHLDTMHHGARRLGSGGDDVTRNLASE
jgi:hypothetical protein